MSVPCEGLPNSLTRIIALVSMTGTSSEQDLLRDFALNTLFHASNVTGVYLLKQLVDLKVDIGFVRDLSTRLLQNEKAFATRIP